MMELAQIAEKLIEHFPGVGDFVIKCNCEKCRGPMQLLIRLRDAGDNRVDIRIEGGAGFGFGVNNPLLFGRMQCDECFASTEVYSRIVGYLRPVKQWNTGKQEEFRNRRMFANAV